MSNQNTPYGTWAPIYRNLGFWPRPLRYPGTDPKTGKPLGKACKETGWQTSDPELDPKVLKTWDAKYPHFNIGLLMGSPFPDGTTLGALDIDHDQYTNLGRALLGGNPPCGRFGKKGAVFFVRILGDVPNQKFKVKGEANAAYGQVAECFFRRSQVVIPPSIHPDTKSAYQWLGTPLHEIDFTKLPIVGA